MSDQIMVQPSEVNYQPTPATPNMIAYHFFVMAHDRGQPTKEDKNICDERTIPLGKVTELLMLFLESLFLSADPDHKFHNVAINLAKGLFHEVEMGRVDKRITRHLAIAMETLLFDLYGDHCKRVYKNVFCSSLSLLEGIKLGGLEEEKNTPIFKKKIVRYIKELAHTLLAEYRPRNQVTEKQKLNLILKVQGIVKNRLHHQYTYDVNIACDRAPSKIVGKMADPFYLLDLTRLLGLAMQLDTDDGEDEE